MDRCPAVRRSTKPYLDSLEDEDVFVEIMKRIPDLKHIHRCKCVCKRWNKIISCDYFIRCYALHKSLDASSPPPFNLFYHHVRGFRSAFKRHGLFKSPGFSLDFLPQPTLPPEILYRSPDLIARAVSDISRVESSSNGLLLRCDTMSSDSPSQYYVCNPLTKKWFAISPPPTETPKLVRLGFVSKPQPHMYNNNSCSSDSFRIVRVPNYEDEMPRILVAEIYASETGEWSESVLDNNTENTSLFRKFLYCPQRSSAIACNGLLHWRSGGNVFVVDPYNNNTNRLYMNLKLPRDGSDMAKECGLGECKGYLRCIVPGYTDSFAVWELKDYDNEGEWCLVKRICLDQMTIQGPHGPEWMNVDRSYKCLCFHPFDGDVVFLWQFFRIVLCNMRTKTVSHLCDLYGSSSSTSLHPVGLPVVLPWWPISVLMPSR